MSEITQPQGSFSGPLRIEEMPGEDRWILLEALTYVAKDGRIFTVPLGTVTDLASIPRFIWPLYHPAAPGYRKSAVVHDELYSRAELFSGDDHGHISRGAVDDLFHEMMGVEGFRPTGRRAVWLGVRSGGWLPWKRYRKAYVPPAPPTERDAA